MTGQSYKTIRFAKNDIVFEENQAGDCAFLIKKGTVTVYKTVKDKKLVLSTMKAGDIIGEMAVITGEARSASAVATSDAELLVINESVLQTALDDTLPFIKVLVQQILDRFQSMNDKHEDTSLLYQRVKTLEDILLEIKDITIDWAKSQPAMSNDNRKFLKAIDDACTHELRSRCT
jgi:CRP-like cAMP-binding protein